MEGDGDATGRSVVIDLLYDQSEQSAIARGL